MRQAIKPYPIFCLVCLIYSACVATEAIHERPGGMCFERRLKCHVVELPLKFSKVRKFHGCNHRAGNFGTAIGLTRKNDVKFSKTCDVLVPGLHIVDVFILLMDI